MGETRDPVLRFWFRLLLLHQIAFPGGHCLVQDSVSNVIAEHHTWTSDLVSCDWRVLEDLHPKIVTGVIKDSDLSVLRWSLSCSSASSCWPWYFVASRVSLRRVAWWPRSWNFDVATQPIRSGSGGVSCVFYIPGPTPTWCDLWRCREMITKLHFEGVQRGIPGPTPSTGTNPTTGRGVSPRHPGRRLPPNFYTTGTNPRTGHHWTACLCPVIRRRRRHWKSPQRKSKGGNGGGVSAYLWRCPGETVSCGAAQLYPTRPPLVLCLGFFWPLVTTGAIPRTGFQVSPRGFLVLSR